MEIEQALHGLTFLCLFAHVINKGCTTDSDSSDAFCTRAAPRRYIELWLCFNVCLYGFAGD